MKVIDAFTFYNEFDLLKLRLEYLNDLVDYFIIAESNYTHSGKPKPYYLNDILEEIPTEIRSKIISLHYEPNIDEFNFPDEVMQWSYGDDYWKLERQQRNFISSNLSSFAPDDLFMLSDVDEIPRREIVQQFIKESIEGSFCICAKCEFFYYNFNTLCNSDWAGPVFSTVQNAIDLGCDTLRTNRFSFPFIQDAGWHFSYFGNTQQIQNKLESFAHQEYNKSQYKSEENILTSIQNKKNIFDGAELHSYNFQKFPDDISKLIVKYFSADYYNAFTNTIDVVIPTMWCDENFISYLERYCSYENIQKIYLIDNQKSNKPKNTILQHPKIHLITPYQNIYVNPAWNEGYYKSKADVICLLNDDIFVEEELFDYISNLDMTNIDIIGSYLKGTVDNYHINSDHYVNDELIKLNVNKKQPIGGQSYAFGVCMFIKRSSYKVIPSLYKIWYGDDYLIQNCENIYALKTNKIQGRISKTIITNEKKNTIQKRIDLDTYNAYKYNHFQNAQNWSIMKHKMESPKNIFGY
jgi:beta-1,4-mannosyl-glycoprotein beta-1,4-N-acetylglucosaminyltransferase